VAKDIFLTDLKPSDERNKNVSNAVFIQNTYSAVIIFISFLCRGCLLRWTMLRDNNFERQQLSWNKTEKSKCF